MISLTLRQQDALRFIIGFEEAKGRSPFYREIAEGRGLASQGSAHKIVCSLAERGAVRLGFGSERTITVTAPIAIPRAPDGEPLYFVPIGEARS